MEKEIKINEFDRKNYRMIHRDGVHNSKLSLKAKGLLWYFLDKPDGWKGQIYDVVNSNEKDGIKSIRTAIKELEDAGYISLRCYPKVNGKFQGKYYEINEKNKKKK